MFLLFLLSAVLFQADAQTGAQSQIIDNDRVAVSRLSGPLPAQLLDAVVISGTGSATFLPKGTPLNHNGVSTVILLKGQPVPPIENKTGYPLAFPRAGSKKILENADVIVWDYTWERDIATPMHFHDKDVVVVYFEDGDLKSTTLDRKATMNPYKPGDIRFNRSDRTHTETLIRGKQRAIITELK